MANYVQDLGKFPRWLILVVLGFVPVGVAVIRASVASVDIGGVHIKPDPESASRYVGAVVLAGLGIAVIVFGLIARRTEQGEAEVPVTQIAINDARLDRARTSDPQYLVSGQVSPANPGVRVWLLRESIAQRRGEFTLSGAGHATTDDKGHWEQSIIMWSGPFHIHAVVTTDDNDRFYRWCVSAREAALKIVQQQNSNTYDVPGWPPLDFLPNPRVSANRRIDVRPTRVRRQWEENR